MSRAIKERERLLAERRRITEARDRIVGRQRELETARGRAIRETEAAYAAHARGDEGADELVAAATAAEETIARERVSALSADRGVARALDENDTALTTLHHDELDAFVADAEQATREATDALLALEPALRDAGGKWARARAKYSPLFPALRAAVVQQDAARGLMRDPSVVAADALVGEFPLASLSELMTAVRSGLLAPRPAALREVPQDGDDVIAVDLREVASPA